MDNTNVGGNRGNFAEQPVDFESLFEGGLNDGVNRANNSRTGGGVNETRDNEIDSIANSAKNGEMGDLYGDKTERGLGNTAVISEGVAGDIFGSAPTPKISETPGASEALRSGGASGVESLSTSGVETEGEIENGSNVNLGSTTETKPLAADGSTEGRLGRLAVDLSGDAMDETSVKEVRKKLSDYKKDPFELMNYRDEAMVASLRDNYGRIFADDGNEGNDISVEQSNVGQRDVDTRQSTISDSQSGGTTV